MLEVLRPARVPAPVLQACGYFLPRLMFLQGRYAPQVHWGDIALALDGFPVDDLDLRSERFWDEWRGRWVGQAERYRAVAAGSSTPAGRARAYRGAAACYHWAEFMDFGDAARKLALRRNVRDCFERSLVGGDLDLIPGRMPAGRLAPVDLPYWVVLPPPNRRGPGPMPAVILSNGLDSMTEVEVLAIAETFLDRGIAAVLFDGPGQGIHVGQLPLRIDMETVVAALVERLGEHGEIAVDRLGFLGVSFGGYLALRVAQRLGELFRCVVNLSGGPVVSPFEGLPRRLREDFRFALMGGDSQDMQARFDGLEIDVSVPAETSVLSVHGGLDDIFPVGALSGLDSAWGAGHELRVYPAESHVCLNLINSCSLEAADWVADRLSGEPRGAARS